MHRSWGPLEPFDNSFPELLRRRGIYSHLVTDHYHYFEDGGGGYHQRYDTWDFVRGQEADPWHALVAPPLEEFRNTYHPLLIDGEARGGHRLQNLINRKRLQRAEDFPAFRCFESGLEFLEENRDQDDWFLQIEAFDPHEPFHAPSRFRADYPTDYPGPILDWPRYRQLVESSEEAAELRANYAAVVAMCDERLGTLLDYLDEHAMWNDTALVITTDHGLLLGEHDWWGKNRMPIYNEIAHLPLMIHHPAIGAAGTRRSALTQTPDLMPTFLDMFGVAVPPEVTARSLLPLLAEDGAGHEAVLFGIFGGATNVTDGRYTCFCYPQDMTAPDLFEYTLLPLHATAPFSNDEFAGAELVGGFSFTKGYPLLRMPAHPAGKRPPLQGGAFADTRSLLFDLAADPAQMQPITSDTVRAGLTAKMCRLMAESEAPPEAYARLGLPVPAVPL
jgi:arylsulfatase A-like enzyme